MIMRDRDKHMSTAPHHTGNFIRLGDSWDTGEGYHINRIRPDKNNSHVES